MRLTVIIVSWNVRELIRQNLKALSQENIQGSLEVIVVDNASTDGTTDIIREEFPKVHLVENHNNMGFAYACNQASLQAGGQYLFFLNPDARVRPGAMAFMADHLDRHPEIAMLGPRLSTPDGAVQPSVRRDPNLAAQLLIILKLRRLLSMSQSLRDYYWSEFDYDSQQEVPQLMGAAMMVRRSDFEAVGRFDDKFFLWFEEVDLCIRLRLAGKKIVYFPSAAVYHLGAASFRQEKTLRKQVTYIRSLRYFFLKHHGFFAATIITLVQPLSLALALAQQLFYSHGAGKNK